MANRLWKVTVSSLFPNDNRVESIYEGHHADDASARDAALHKEAINNGGSTIARVVAVEEVG
ncbi:hypothetical protein [Sphingomonas sp. PAMC 26621]|uniref:hypothetical protein n=1 Tax=Sphingomonas sp. PAMC 26621 TaxID=1112213 RepID=UPI00028848B6|nr:hypothetical protein [Sphingomonas sp. PAMC 26621]